MIYQIAFQTFLGLPLVAWGGIITLVSLLTTATLGFLYRTGRARFRFRWHWIAASVAIILGISHGAIALLALLGF